MLCLSPSGWDNEKKIAILHENLQTIKADDNFEDVIVKPPVRKVSHCPVGVVDILTMLFHSIWSQQHNTFIFVYTVDVVINLLFILSLQFVHEKEIQAEDDQVFLVKLQVMY